MRKLLSFSAPAKDIGYLDLPDAPDFISKEPDITFEQNIRQCEEMLPFWNKERNKELPDKEEADFYL